MTTKKASKTYVADRGNTGWNQNDPRSVSAMLRGSGDSRSRRYEMFLATQMARNPAKTREAIDEEYSLFVRRQANATYNGRPTAYGSEMEKAEAIRHEVHAEFPLLGKLGDVVIYKLIPLGILAITMKCLANYL